MAAKLRLFLELIANLIQFLAKYPHVGSFSKDDEK
jgi:hypothetical protein